MKLKSVSTYSGFLAAQAVVNKHVSFREIGEREQNSRRGEETAKASLARAASYSVAAK